MEKHYEKRLEKLFFYSPYHFLRSIPAQKQIDEIVHPLFSEFSQKADNQIINVRIGEHTFHFFVSFLAWDSRFFQIPVYKLLSVLYDPLQAQRLVQACECFLENLKSPPKTRR